MKKVVLSVAVLAGLLAVASPTAHAGPLQGCASDLPFGAPNVSGAVQIVCHRGYVAWVDMDRKVPLLVAYRLAPPATNHCCPRRNNFRTDAALPVDRRAVPEDYHESGVDMGHQAPAEDFAGDEAEMSDSFSMASMAPQLPGLNRQGWERIEDDVRGWGSREAYA